MLTSSFGNDVFTVQYYIHPIITRFQHYVMSRFLSMMHVPMPRVTVVGLASVVISVACLPVGSHAFFPVASPFVSASGPSSHQQQQHHQQYLLSNQYLENDLVAIDIGISNNSKEEGTMMTKSRLCVVRTDGSVYPLCRRQDDVETDLLADPREYANQRWNHVTDDQVLGTYGEGWYGQRPVPSLGGGPGYGADADEVWSVDEAMLEQIMIDGVEVPVIDMGIAHGEKSRAGAF